MPNWQTIGFHCVILCGALAFIGCSSTEVTPEFSTGAPAELAQIVVKPEAIPAFAMSSLEALQRGESTATPASSPLKDIYFDFDSYDLSAEMRAMLKANAAWLRENPAVTVDIEGHCDERGSNDYNMALGAKRAQAAMDYLTTLGVSASRLSTTSYGEEIPVCQEHTEECWQRNRRGRFVIQPTRSTS